jgi:hypothetical protein
MTGQSWGACKISLRPGTCSSACLPTPFVIAPRKLIVVTKMPDEREPKGVVQWGRFGPFAQRGGPRSESGQIVQRPCGVGIMPKARMGEIVLASYAAPFSISVWSCRACCGIPAIAAVLNVQHYGSGPPDQGSGRVPRPRSGANNDPSPLNPVKRPWGRLREGAESYAKVLDSDIRQ